MTTYESLNKSFKDIEKEYLQSFNKEELYRKIGTLYCNIFSYLDSVKFGYVEDIQDSKKITLKKHKKKLNFLLKDFEKNYYLNWIKQGDFEIKLKNSVKRSNLETYFRKYNFDLISYSDPFTEDEISYIIEFVEDCFPNQYKNFNDMPLPLIQTALYSLLTN